MRIDSRGGLVTALICYLVLFAWLLMALPIEADSPLTASQTITLERGPDGLWLSQAWIVELHARADTRLALIYDTWRVATSDAPDLALAYQQWDISATYAGKPVMRVPWSVTGGVRWRTGITGRSYGGAGPWEYLMLSIGW